MQNEHKDFSDSREKASSSVKQKTIYDDIRITKRSTDIIIIVFSLLLLVLFVFAVCKS